MSRPPASRWLTRLVLFALLLASLAWVWHLRRLEPTPLRRDQVQLGAGFGEIAKYVFRVSDDSVVVDRQGSEYWVTYPVRDRADLMFLAEVRRLAGQLKIARILPDSGGAAYGLDPPRSRITLENVDGLTWTMAVGDSTPVGSQYYARVEGEHNPVVLIEQFAVRKYFRPAANAVRDRVTAPLREAPLDSLHVLAVTGDVCARRDEAAQWSCRIPAGFRLDPARVDPVLQAFRGPEIVGYETAGVPLSSLGLDPPRATWILFQGSRAETVLVGHPTSDARYVRVRPAGRPAVALLPTEYFRNMVDGWPALVDLHLLEIPADSLTTVTFLGVSPASSYAKREGRWRRLPSGHAVPGRQDLPNDLRNLGSLSWKSYPRQPNDPPPHTPQMQLLLQSASRAETLTLAAPRGSDGWARSSRLRSWGPVPGLSWEVWHYREQHSE